ncbi:hypothetical protein ACA545_01200 [Vibrio cholerae]|uniref:hypothetical protein n=1 Tax=Vibrio cholerae TaxID=666 RepID=UPI003A0FBEA7
MVDLGCGNLGFSTSITADKLVGGSSIKASLKVTSAAADPHEIEYIEDVSVS